MAALLGLTVERLARMSAAHTAVFPIPCTAEGQLVTAVQAAHLPALTQHPRQGGHSGIGIPLRHRATLPGGASLRSRCRA
eukprot:7377805-Prymnesium_polylepis.3